MLCTLDVQDKDANGASATQSSVLVGQPLAPGRRLKKWQITNHRSCQVSRVSLLHCVTCPDSCGQVAEGSNSFANSISSHCHITFVHPHIKVLRHEPQ